MFISSFSDGGVEYCSMFTNMDADALAKKAHVLLTHCALLLCINSLFSFQKKKLIYGVMLIIG